MIAPVNELMISVAIPTHNPDPQRLNRVLDALSQQTLDSVKWELLIIDNASVVPVESHVVLSASKYSVRVIREPRLGLTSARWRGITEAKAPLIIFVDDDNVLSPSYLEEVYKVFRLYPSLGAVGGKSLPEYEQEPPFWFREGMAPLGCRDLGASENIFQACDYVRQPTYPTCSPIGAGMALRREAVSSWLDSALFSSITDRRGDALSSAGDCDLVLHVLESGWDVGYFPSLSLTHLIGAARVHPPYLEAISRTAFCDFIRVLDLHGIRPWSAIPAWSIPLRAVKAWFSLRVWRGPAERLRWQGAIGQFEGRAALPIAR